jgi:hypothetical protein
MAYRVGCRRILAAAAGLMVAASAVGPAWPQQASPLRGEAFIAGKTPIDPPPNEPKSSHAYLTITGPAALRMYRNMRAKAEPNLCEEGKTMKRAGPLMCSIAANGREASCDFSVDLIRGRLDDGRPC